MAILTISAKTMEGTDAIDPAVTVDIFDVTGLEQQVVHKYIGVFDGEVVLNVEQPEDSFPTWRVTVTFSRFDAGPSFLFQPRGEPNKRQDLRVARLPGRWTPSFHTLAALATGRFGALKKVVAVSDNVDLKMGPRIGDLQANYNSMAGQAQVLAKAALLNLYAVLLDESDPIGKIPWFSYVRKIVRLDQERFVAEVSPTLFENVETIVNKLGSTYAAQGYFTESDADLALHVGNIPTAYHSDANLVRGETLKKDYEQGNLQLTVWFLRVDGVAVHLLDCDMDENRNLLLHSFDILRHLGNGGTSPIAMHEYIVKDSAMQAGGVATVDLGYTLV